MPPQVALSMSSSPSGSCALALMPSALKPIDSDSPERDDAADDRPAQDAVALEHADERERAHLDLAQGRLVGLEPVVGDLVGQRLADRHRPGRDAAHHDALEHGLAADGGVALGLETSLVGHGGKRGEPVPAARC